MLSKISLAAVNRMCRSDFTAAFGDIFEHSSWIAERAFDKKPFSDIAQLHQAMVAVVNRATDDDKLKLLRVHPELAGREAQAGELTGASTSEQASVGLNALNKDELTHIARLNREYLARFKFPFIIAVRQSTKDEIFDVWESRLKNTPAQEIAIGLEQVTIIARLRLEDLINTSENTMNDTQTGKLSTHVLDSSNGCPAADVQIELFRFDDGDYRLLKTVRTNKDGRTDQLLLDAKAMTIGKYQLVFHIGSYFAEIEGLSDEQARAAFLDDVPIRFTISNANANYHVPLVTSAWSYSTYRGS